MRREESTPESFPRAAEKGWVPGAGEKYVASYDGSRFIVGSTPAELYARYLGCCDLLDDLFAYCERKKVDAPQLDAAALRRRIHEGLQRSPDVGITAPEHQWVMDRLAEAMGWKLE